MNLQDQYNQDMKDFLSEEMFPSEALPERFHEYRSIALAFETPKSMNISNEIFRALVIDQIAIRKELALYEVHTVITAMERRTFNDYSTYYGVNTAAAGRGMQGAYIGFLADLEAMTSVFNSIVAPKADSFKRKYQAMNRIQGTAPKKQIHIGKN